MTVIELADEDAAALEAKAAAAGLRLEAWLKQLAGTADEPQPPVRPFGTSPRSLRKTLKTFRPR